MTFEIEIVGHENAISCEHGESVLDAIERAGFAIPYSCRKGVCATCECELVSGEVAIGRSGHQNGPQSSVRVCVATPQTNIAIAPRWIVKATRQDRKRFRATVYRVTQKAIDVTELNLRLPIGRRMPFRAGQYIRVHFGDGQSRNYSLANSPRDNNQIVLHIRHLPGGRFSGVHLPRLTPGASLEVEGPFGQCSPDVQDVGPIVMLATGTGLAPFKSILADLVDRRVQRPVHLFWGARTSADVYDQHSLESLSKHRSWFQFTPVLTNAPEGWSGRQGFVQRAALDAYPDMSEIKVLACGNPNMIKDARTLMQAEGNLPAEAFIADAFVPSGSAAQ